MSVPRSSSALSRQDVFVNRNKIMQIHLGDQNMKFGGPTAYQQDFNEMKSRKVKKIRAISIG
jgi:hypothetical protein